MTNYGMSPTMGMGQSYNMTNQLMPGGMIQNHVVPNTAMLNPAMQNPILQNPIMQNQTMQNQVIQNPMMPNQVIQNQVIQNPMTVNAATNNPYRLGSPYYTQGTLGYYGANPYCTRCGGKGWNLLKDRPCKKCHKHLKRHYEH